MSRTVGAKICPFCTFEGRTLAVILTHLRSVHSSDPHFIVMCGISGCTTTSKSFSALYSHIYRHHQNEIKKRTKIPSVSTEVQNKEVCRSSLVVSLNESQYETGLADIQYLMGTDAEQVTRSSALFLLKLKEQRRISQVAINDIVEGSQAMLSRSISRVEAGVKAKLAESGLDPSSINGLDGVFLNAIDPFKGIGTCHLQEKYYRETLGLIEPMEIKVGEPMFTPRFSGSKRCLIEKWDTYQYVPLLLSLKQLLSDETVLEEVYQCPQRIHTDDLIEDFCDGDRFHLHPIFSKDPHALQIVAYYDELEVCNPLGSHIKRHKLGIVFYTLGNIAPKYRSQLKLINLAIVATVPVIEKHGLDKILEPFVADLNTLSTTGITVSVQGVEKTFNGALLTFLADNLASNDLGGFKKSFSFSFRCCRTCLATRDSMSSSYISERFELRNEVDHCNHISMLGGPTSGHYSTTYGINRRSCLLDAKYFSLFGGGLPHDAMHDILEGIAPQHIKRLLSHYTTHGILTLSKFNEELINFNFGYSERDRPVPILSRTLQAFDRPLRATASQTLLLIRIMPFILANKLPEDEEHWLCFLHLRKIIDNILCPISSESLCSSLKILINDHHRMFVKLYGPNAYFPKMHFMLHYPEQIRNIGPMIRTWTIRHEAKLNFFKKASHVANFKNIAFSLANRHQRWMCYELAYENLVRTPLQCGPAKGGFSRPSLVQDENNEIQDCLVGIIPQLSLLATVYRLTWVHREGIHYQSNNAYLIIGSDGLDPIFGDLEDLIVVGGNMVTFHVSVCNVLYFDSHFHAYVISITPRQTLFNCLLDPNVYHGHKGDDGNTYITLKYYFIL